MDVYYCTIVVICPGTVKGFIIDHFIRESFPDCSCMQDLGESQPQNPKIKNKQLASLFRENSYPLLSLISILIVQ